MQEWEEAATKERERYHTEMAEYKKNKPATPEGSPSPAKAKAKSSQPKAKASSSKFDCLHLRPWPNPQHLASRTSNSSPKKNVKSKEYISDSDSDDSDNAAKKAPKKPAAAAADDDDDSDEQPLAAKVGPFLREPISTIRDFQKEEDDSDESDESYDDKKAKKKKKKVRKTKVGLGWNWAALCRRRAAPSPAPTEPRASHLTSELSVFHLAVIARKVSHLCHPYGSFCNVGPLGPV